MSGDSKALAGWLPGHDARWIIATVLVVAGLLWMKTDGLERRFDDLRAEVVYQMTQLRTDLRRIDDRLRAVELALRDVENRLDAVENRLDAVENRLDAVENRLDAVENRLDAIENRLDAVEHTLRAHDDRLRAVETAVVPAGPAPGE